MAWANPKLRRSVACLGIVDPKSGQCWLVDCTPDFPDQLQIVQRNSSSPDSKRKISLAGVLLTHAHIGHYTGLMHLGREVMGSRRVPVFAMPRMQKFLRNNGPWSQLVTLGNIELIGMRADSVIRLNDRITIRPFRVPHRDEFSETVGFQITGPSRSVVYIPDIDKWERWERRIETLIESVDVAYLDGTFFGNGEIPGRDMSLIPHPFIAESLDRFARMNAAERSKIRFIHLNHTNPALNTESAARRQIEAAGCRIAVQGEKTPL